MSTLEAEGAGADALTDDGDWRPDAEDLAEELAESGNDDLSIGEVSLDDDGSFVSATEDLDDDVSVLSDDLYMEEVSSDSLARAIHDAPAEEVSFTSLLTRGTKGVISGFRRVTSGIARCIGSVTGVISSSDEVDLDTLDELNLAARDDHKLPSLQGLSIEAMRNRPKTLCPEEKLGVDMGLPGLRVSKSQERDNCRFNYYFTTSDGKFHTLSIEEAMKHCKVKTVKLQHTPEALQRAEAMGYPEGSAVYPIASKNKAYLYRALAHKAERIGLSQLVLTEKGGPPTVLAMANGGKEVMSIVGSQHDKNEVFDLMGKLSRGEINSFDWGEFNVENHNSSMHPPFVRGVVSEQAQKVSSLKSSVEKGRAKRGSGKFTITKDIVDAKVDDGWNACGDGRQMTHAASLIEASKAICKSKSKNTAVTRPVSSWNKSNDPNKLDHTIVRGCKVEMHVYNEENTSHGQFKSYTQRLKEVEEAEKDTEAESKFEAKSKSNSKPKSRSTQKPMMKPAAKKPKVDQKAAKDKMPSLSGKASNKANTSSAKQSKKRGSVAGGKDAPSKKKPKGWAIRTGHVAQESNTRVASSEDILSLKKGDVVFHCKEESTDDYKLGDCVACEVLLVSEVCIHFTDQARTVTGKVRRGSRLSLEFRDWNMLRLAKPGCIFTTK